MSIRQNGKVIAGATQYHPDLFDWKWADHQLDDVQWLRADTFSWQSGAVYESAYQHLVDDIDGKTAQTETIAGTTITYYLADDGHKICPASEESNVSAIYNATGVAWYYIIDTANTRFKLPRSKHNKYAETLSVVGNGMTMGMTNGTANYGLQVGNQNQGTYHQNQMTIADTKYGSAVGTTYERYAAGLFQTIGLTTDGTKSGIIAQQEQDTDQYKYLYFYVGSFTQTAVENTAGLNTELFNGKADIDFNNITSTGKETSVGWVMPDYSAGISLSGWQATNTNFTVPCAGYIQVFMATVGGALETFYIDDIPCCAIINSYTQYTGNAVGGRFIEGGVHTFRSATPSRTQSVIFYPCKGVL